MTERTDIMKRFGRRLADLRKAKGLSQEKLGFACDLTQTYLSEVEQGKRNISLVNIYLLAKALEITMAELMQGIE